MHTEYSKIYNAKKYNERMNYLTLGICSIRRIPYKKIVQHNINLIVASEVHSDDMI